MASVGLTLVALTLLALAMAALAMLVLVCPGGLGGFGLGGQKKRDFRAEHS